MEEPIQAEQKKLDLYKNYLINQGYRPEVDEDGDIFFKREGRGFYIFPNENDKEYFRISLPNFWSIENEAERLQVLEACNYTNALTKVVKVHTVKNNTNVWASVEMFLKNPQDFEPIFERSCRAIISAVESFAEKMRGEEKK